MHIHSLDPLIFGEFEGSNSSGLLKGNSAHQEYISTSTYLLYLSSQLSGKYLEPNQQLNLYVLEDDFSFPKGGIGDRSLEGNQRITSKALMLVLEPKQRGSMKEAHDNRVARMEDGDQNLPG